MDDDLLEEEIPWQCGGHGIIVELGEGEGRLAELAVFFLRVGQPFHQTLLVDEAYAAATFARVEQRLLCGPLTTAYSTTVSILFCVIWLIVWCGRDVCWQWYRWYGERLLVHFYIALHYCDASLNVMSDMPPLPKSDVYSRVLGVAGEGRQDGCSEGRWIRDDTRLEAEVMLSKERRCFSHTKKRAVRSIDACEERGRR